MTHEVGCAPFFARCNARTFVLVILNEGQTRNSNIRLRDQIVETLFSCYDDSPLHSKIL